MIATEAPPPGRLQAILSSEGPIIIIISEVHESRELSLALRIVHILQIHHQLDSTIITEGEALAKSRSASWDSGNLVVIGQPSSNFVTYLLDQREGPIRTKVLDTTFRVHHRQFDRPGQSILHCLVHIFWLNSASLQV